MRLFRYSVSEAATFFPMSAIVKPIHVDQADSKASMPDYQNVKAIAATLTRECECYYERERERDFDLYCTLKFKFLFFSNSAILRV